MKRVWPKPSLVAVLLAVFTLGWTGTNGVVSTVGLETELAKDDAGCTAAAPCPAVAGDVLAHWISRTKTGNLFLVMPASCQSVGHCAARFVERTAQGTATRLNIEGQFRVLHSDKSIPDVQAWRALSDSETEYTRYTWTAGAYIKVETRTAYSVDGVECGTALECYQTANKAHAEHKTGRALKIWEKVHTVSWI